MRGCGCCAGDYCGVEVCGEERGCYGGAEVA
jgi:hypothetical protein